MNNYKSKDECSSISESSPNLEFKIPETGTMNFNFSESARAPIMKLIEAQEDSELPINNNNVNLGNKTTRARKTFKNMESPRKKAKESAKKKSVVADSTKSSTSPNFTVIFGILKFFRKHFYYKSPANLNDHHLHLIDDPATMAVNYPRKRDKKMKYKSIWQATSQGLEQFTAKFSKFIERIPLFDPNNIVKIIWDLMILLLLLIELYIYSIDRCFDVTLLDDKNPSHSFFIITILLMIIDIISTINTRIYIEGISVRRRGFIFWNYLKRAFFIDVASFFGICLYFSGSKDSVYIDLNLLLVLKIVGTKTDLASRFKDLIIKKDKNADALYELLSLGAKIMTFAHIVACLWHLISYSSSSQNSLENSWLKENKLFYKDWKQKYLFSIYWSVTTMLTVGYGDITPKNDKEVLFNIFTMLFGCVIFGYSMSAIGEILKKWGDSERMLKNNLNQLKEMARNMNLTSDLEHKLRKYLEFVWNQEEKNNAEQEMIIMNKLTRNLRDKIYLQTNVKFLKSIPILSKILSESTLINLSSAMKKVRYSPEEFVFKATKIKRTQMAKAGSLDDSSLFIVVEGKIDIVTSPIPQSMKTKLSWETLRKGSYFGIHELFTDFPRRNAAVTKEFTTLFQISRVDFLSIIQQNPEEYEKFCKIRDGLVLYDNTYPLELKCSSCGRVDHYVLDCKFLKYSPNKIIVISKHTMQKKKQLKNFQRRTKLKESALLQLYNNRNFLNEFLEVYEDDDELIMLGKKYSDTIEPGAAVDEELKSPSNRFPSGKLEKDVENMFEKSNSGNDEIISERKITLDVARFANYQREPTAFRNRRKSRYGTYLMKHRTTGDQIQGSLNGDESSEGSISDAKQAKPQPVNGSVGSNDNSNFNFKWTEFFLGFERMQSYKFYFPKNNSERILRRITYKLLKIKPYKSIGSYEES